MKLIAREGYGPPLEFECFDNWLSRWMCESILAGRTYPRLPGVDDVSTIVDVGANCGAASVYFARSYPEATIHAIEPASAPFKLLARNTRSLPNASSAQPRLFSADRAATLYAGACTLPGSRRSSSGAAGIPRAARRSRCGRHADGCESRASASSIDVLKVDVEGCETEILEEHPGHPARRSRPFTSNTTASQLAERSIGTRLEPTHELVHGVMFLDQGEVIYVHRSVLGDGGPIVDFFRRREPAPIFRSIGRTSSFEELSNRAPPKRLTASTAAARWITSDTGVLPILDRYAHHLANLRLEPPASVGDESGRDSRIATTMSLFPKPGPEDCRPDQDP